MATNHSAKNRIPSKGPSLLNEESWQFCLGKLGGTARFFPENGNPVLVY